MAAVAPDPRALERAAELIAAAARPVVVAGGQCDGAEDAAWLLALAEALPAPLVATPRAGGLFPSDHALVMGLLAGAEDPVLGAADLALALGLEPEELAGRWPAGAAVVQCSRRRRAGYPFTPLVEVEGDLGLILGELAPRLRGKARADWDMGALHRLRRGRGSA
jgi:acetolactate synthase-1/2/3 large subunit